MGNEYSGLRPIGLTPLSEQWEPEGWGFETNAQFSGWADRRALYTIRHPFTESQTGDIAKLTRQVRLPADWRGPVLLSFCATDDHHGEGYDPTEWPHWVGADLFVGHRFRQVLIDGQVVWERDVADSDSPDWRSSSSQGTAYRDCYHVVDIGEHVRPGQEFELTLRICDKVGSGIPLPGDVHQAHFWEPAEFDRTQTNKWFDFTAWWGDVFLCSGQDAPGARITFDSRIRLQSAPLDADARPVKETSTRVTLTIARAETLPSVPYPLWGGVPFPRRLVAEEGQIRLSDERGHEVACQVQVCSRWPDDGSVQWAWINLLAAPGQRELTMECGPGVSRGPADTPLRVTECEGRLTIATGATTVTLPQPGEQALIQTLQAPGKPACGPVVGVLNQQMLGSIRKHITLCQEIVIEERGPVRAAVRLAGEMVAPDGQRFGRFVARLWAWAGSPLLSLSYRIFQDTDQLVAIVDDLLLEVNLPFKQDIRGGFSRQTFAHELPDGQVRELELRASQPDSYTITGKRSAKIEEGEHAPGWVDVRGHTDEGTAGGVACGVRWFWQQHPKTLTVTAEGIIIGLFQRRMRDDWELDSPLYMMTRGEAKRHEVWLWAHDGEVTADTLNGVQKAWDARPHLLNGQWIARSGVLGNFAQHGPANFLEMDRFLQTWDSSELSTVRYGMRDFRETRWCQNYRGRAANALLEYFASGRPQWQEYFEQVMAHNLDVDTIHHDPDHPAWVGAIRDYAPYHTTGAASHGISSNCQDQFLHYFFVGEPDSRREATMAADYIARLSGDQGRSARQEGWPLAQMAIAYLWTGKPAYRKAAEDFFEFAHLFTHPRRGAYDEIHSTFSHRGIVPFMTGYLGFGLIRYHQATGDERAARLLVALTEATISETGDGNGGFWYSPCASQHAWGSTSWSALIGGMAAYSYRVTGDPWFAQQTRIIYDRIATSGGPSLDMAPLLGEMLAGIETARSCGVLE